MERILKQKPTVELALSATAVATIAVLWGIYMIVSGMHEMSLAGPIIMLMGTVHLVYEKWGVAAVIYEDTMSIKIGRISCSVNDRLTTIGTSVFFPSILDPNKFIHLDTLYLDEESLYYLSTAIRVARGNTQS